MSLIVIDVDELNNNDDYIIIRFAFLNSLTQINKQGKVFVDLSVNGRQEKIFFETSDKMIVGALEILMKYINSEDPDKEVLKIGHKFLARKVKNILKLKENFNNVAIGIIEC